MLVIGISGTELTAQERDWLQHDAVAGVILFTRNYASREQVTELCAAIRSAAPRPQLVCVDQEGGRVQRFREGFSALPPLAGFDAHYARDRQDALRRAEEHAWLMASEIRACGIDISFAPVVDLARGNRAIGDRAFSADPRAVAEFTRAYVRGMHGVGMAATLKHFPGHGTVLEDTHFDDAVDPRPLEALRETDLVPFAAGIEAGADAVMLAHVSYPAVAPEPAGYSPFWINTVLREEMGFRGVVFSDDIGMAAAFSVGGVKARIDVHLDAGCDAVLVCSPKLVDESLRA
ncbi:MAG TPA: beta-N-acetylhexosaminidase, partial [Pseudoxanthomonas sp.]|nr:beta-N-acetylhexosaminidase [Pseudoxanthomonas sp.]